MTGDTAIASRYEPYGIEVTEGDAPFDSSPLKRVEDETDEGWTVSTESGWTTFLPRLREDQRAPEVGDLFEVFGALGYQIEGQRLAGEVIFYRDTKQREASRRRWLENREAQQHRDFVRGRDRLDRQYDALPPLFKARIDRFRAEDPEFRIKSESYELFCLGQATVIADALGTMEAIDAFSRENWDEQNRLVPGLDSGHSGNTFGAAVAMARSLVRARNGAAVSV